VDTGPSTELGRACKTGCARAMPFSCPKASSRPTGGGERRGRQEVGATPAAYAAFIQTMAHAPVQEDSAKVSAFASSCRRLAVCGHGPTRRCLPGGSASLHHVFVNTRHLVHPPRGRDSVLSIHKPPLPSITDLHACKHIDAEKAIVVGRRQDALSPFGLTSSLTTPPKQEQPSHKGLAPLVSPHGIVGLLASCLRIHHRAPSLCFHYRRPGTRPTRRYYALNFIHGTSMARRGRGTTTLTSESSL